MSTPIYDALIAANTRDQRWHRIRGSLRYWGTLTALTSTATILTMAWLR